MSVRVTKMKFLIPACISFLLVVSLLAPAAEAVGIKWSTEREMVSELSQKCIVYGVYNPSAEDATVKLSVSKELEEVVQGAVSQTKTVLAGTTHDQAVQLELCFWVPKVYAADCLAGDLLCEQSCTQDEVSYSGEILAVEVNEEGGGGMGSATTVGASVPLMLRVSCSPYKRDWTPVYAIVVVAAVAGIAGRTYLKKKKK
jgi:hypothetical protein